MWATLPQARDHWPDAVAMDDTVLTDYLSAAYPAVYAYAPKLIDHIVTSCTTGTGSPLVTSSVGGFVSTDVGRSVSGTGVPAAATILAVQSEYVAVLSANATATGIVDLTVSGIPTGYMLANVFQAREIAAAALRNEQDVIGVGDYAIRARPLTAAVKQLLRPMTKTPVVG